MPHDAHNHALFWHIGHASFCARSCLIMRTVMPHYAHGHASLCVRLCLIIHAVMPHYAHGHASHYAHGYASLCTQSSLIMRTGTPHYAHGHASLCARSCLIMRTVMPHYAHLYPACQELTKPLPVANWCRTFAFCLSFARTEVSGCAASVGSGMGADSFAAATLGALLPRASVSLANEGTWKAGMSDFCRREVLSVV